MNADNLIPNYERTPSKRKENARKGGIASGESRRRSKLIKEALQKALNGKYLVEDRQLDGYDALAISMIQEALKGNVKAFSEIRDTIGEKPKDLLELETNEISGIKIKFVDKSNANTKKEKDPKIVGDYTPPSNAEE